MSVGTFYSHKSDHINVWRNKVSIVANLNGQKLDFVDENFINESFRQKFPLFKCVAFESKNKDLLSNCDAIIYHINQTKSQTPKDLEYMSIASHEVHMAVVALCYPALGLVRPDKTETQEAVNMLKEICHSLNATLSQSSYLTGPHPSVSDVSIFCEFVPLYEMYCDQTFRNDFPSLFKWFLSCAAHDAFKSVIGSVLACNKPASFNNQLYLQLHHDSSKVKKDKGAAKEKTKNLESSKTNNKAPKQQDLQTEEIKPAPAKKQPFSDLEATTFDLETWKRTWCNTAKDTEAMPWLWQNLDYKGFSFWLSSYKYNEELEIPFMINNLIKGAITRMGSLCKYGFGVFHLYGTGQNGSGNYELYAVFLLRGQTLAFEQDEDWNQDAYLYDHRKLDPTNDTDKNLISEFFSLKDTKKKFPLYDTYVFK